MANQYEMRQQAAQQQADQKLDELAEKLKELARRQEQEAERQRRRAAAGQTASGGGSGDSQRELAEQAEEAARRLEQLSREENRADLAQSAQQLRQAADAMRRAAANGAAGRGAQSAEALERLRQAEQQLNRSQTGRAERDVADAARRAEESRRNRRRSPTRCAGSAPRLSGTVSRCSNCSTARVRWSRRLTELEKQIDRAAADMRRDERDASRKMRKRRPRSATTASATRSATPARSCARAWRSSDTENFEREIGSNLAGAARQARGGSGGARADPSRPAGRRAQSRAAARPQYGITRRTRTGAPAGCSAGCAGAASRVRRVRRGSRVRRVSKARDKQGAAGSARPGGKQGAAGAAGPGPARPGSARPGTARPGHRAQGQQGQRRQQGAGRSAGPAGVRAGRTTGSARRKAAAGGRHDRRAAIRWRVRRSPSGQRRCRRRMRGSSAPRSGRWSARPNSFAARLGRTISSRRRHPQEAAGTRQRQGVSGPGSVRSAAGAGRGSGEALRVQPPAPLRAQRQ